MESVAEQLEKFQNHHGWRFITLAIHVPKVVFTILLKLFIMA